MITPLNHIFKNKKSYILCFSFIFLNVLFYTFYYHLAIKKSSFLYNRNTMLLEFELLNSLKDNNIHIAAQNVLLVADNVIPRTPNAKFALVNKFGIIDLFMS